MRPGLFMCVLYGIVAFVALAGSGAAEAQCVPGSRYVSPDGSDADNACLDNGVPCATIAHAVAQACAGDTVTLAPGTYTENIVIPKPLKLHSSGNQFNTTIRIGASGDGIIVLASGVTIAGLSIDGNGRANACIRVGDAAHAGVRSFAMYEASVFNGAVGLLFDSTGPTLSANDATLLSSVSVHDHHWNGTPNSGTGVLLVGGNTGFKMAEGRLSENDNAGLLVTAPPVGAFNAQISMNGVRIYNNGNATTADRRSGLEIHSASSVQLLGLDLHDHNGTAGVGDARGILLDGVTDTTLLCTNVHANDYGLEIVGSAQVSILHGRFSGQSGTALKLAPESAAGTSVTESLFSGNGLAVDNPGPSSLHASSCWWGAASGPASVGGSGEAVQGPVDAGNFIARDMAPLFVDKRLNAYWSDPPVAACYTSPQPALDAAPDGGIVYFGTAVFSGHFHVDGKSVSLQGPSYTGECPIAELDGTQFGTPHQATLHIGNASHIAVRNLLIRSSGMGVPCNVHTPEEIGLDLLNVSSSVFQNLCTKESGTTEIKLYGDSDDNFFDNVLMKGIILNSTGREDLCGHRSKQGLYIDGGPACEGGPGATADNNHINNITTRYNSRAVTVRMARNTVITNSSLHGVPCREWDNGDFAVAVWIDMSDGTQLVNNPDIGNDGQTAAVRIQGRTAASCVTEKLDAENNVVSGNVITRSIRGVHLYRGAGDPGGPVGTRVACNTIGAATIDGLPWPGCPMGILNDATVDVGKPANLVTLNDIAGNGIGIRNNAAATFVTPRNWFGSASGPTGAGGSGDSIVGAVDAAPWLASSAMDDADHDGVTECQGDLDDTDATLHPFDGCDGIDNDQDGTLDEDFVSHATTCGQGVCAATGATQCVDGAVTDTCTPKTQNSPDDPSCNGLDDDCDGAVDENFTPVPTHCGAGVCARTGGTTCVGGQPGDTCVPGNPTSPADTLCNGLDDDCNGLVDDAFVPGTSTCGKGVCERTGTTSCADGVLQDSCVAGPPTRPVDDDCNGIDDDCDGSVDEDYAATPTTCGIGACARTGAMACVGGQVTDTCAAGTPLAADDATCDGIDDNCNGTVDEDYASHATTCGQGVCSSTGSTSCVAGHVFDSCTPTSAPTTVDDSCDGLDNNCNGLVDEAYVSQAVTCGQGVCRRTGSTSCVGGAVQTTCTPGQPFSATDFTCDGVDDNCNGTADEDYPTQPVVCGVGVCANAGTIFCSGGTVVQNCTPKQSGTETCNGLDDDCDGIIDDHIPLPVGPQVDAVRSGARTTNLTWPAAPGTVFDVLRGRLELLTPSGGDFTVAVDRCLANDLGATVWLDKEMPAAGAGFWYLMRARNCVGQTSYDELEENGLAAPRDAGIAAAPNACP